MTLGVAIEILRGEVERSLIHYDKNSVNAIRLGIEALRLNKEMREDYPYPKLLILPGETEE